MSAVMTDQQSKSNVTEFFSPGPGERLRAARLSMGFDLAKIASELHLTSRIVEALEADDYSEIGARVFVRGYLKNYARIVDMPAESILRQFDEKWPEDDAHQSMLRESPSLPADGGPSRGWVGAVTWLLIIGSLVLFMMWWRGYLDEIVPAEIRTGAGMATEQTADITPNSDRPLLGEVSEAPVQPDGRLLLPAPSGDLSEAEVVAPDQEESAVTENMLSADDAVSQPDPPVAEESSTIQQVTQTDPDEVLAASADAAEPVSVPASLVLPAVSEPVPVVEAATVSTSTTSSSVDGGAPVVDGSQQIIMTFSAPCWVDVRDSEREFKLFGEMPKGARKVLGGTPPYKLVIGNAEAVTIEVNGKPFDIMPFANGNVARFTLNP